MIKLFIKQRILANDCFCKKKNTWWKNLLRCDPEITHLKDFCQNTIERDKPVTMYRTVSQTGDEFDPKTLVLIYWKKDSERVCTPPLDEPFLLAFIDGLCEIGLGADDGRVSWLGRLSPLGLVGVVGAFMAEHIPDQKHQSAQNSEDHHCNDTCKENTFTVNALKNR